MNAEYFFNFDESELTRYFSEEQEETLQLEFKVGTADINKLFKEICAFANTEGGTLIYGSPEEKEENTKGVKRRFCLGNVTPSTLNKTEDDILASINTSITPLIQGVRIKRIQCKGGGVYVIYVPQSVLRPHQYRGVYYIRINTMSEPAPHSIVESMFFHREPIKLDIGINVRLEREHSELNRFTLSVTNLSVYPAQNVEGYYVLVGKIYQHEDDDVNKKLRVKFLKTRKYALDKSIKSTHSLILNYWYSHHIRFIEIDKPYYCFLMVYIWARDVRATYKVYKLYKNCMIEEVDLTSDNSMKQEFEQWYGHTIKFI